MNSIKDQTSLPEVSFQHIGSGQFCEDGGDLLEGASDQLLGVVFGFRAD